MWGKMQKRSSEEHQPCLRRLRRVQRVVGHCRVFRKVCPWTGRDVEVADGDACSGCRLLKGCGDSSLDRLAMSRSFHVREALEMFRNVLLVGGGLQANGQLSKEN